MSKGKLSKMVLLMAGLLMLAACGTREFIVEQADGTQLGRLTVDRWFEAESVSYENFKSGKRTAYDCRWYAQKCHESK